jgi:hypothetical protein
MLRSFKSTDFEKIIWQLAVCDLFYRACTTILLTQTFSLQLASIVRRKTDFFSGPSGSENGTAAAIQKVNEVLEKHAKLYQQEQEKKKAAEKKKKAKAASTAAAKKATQKKETGVVEMGADGDFDVSGSSSSTPSSLAAAVLAAAKPRAASTSSSSPEKDDKPDTKDDKPDTKDDKPDTSKEIKDADKDSAKEAPPLGNGGTVLGKYVWTQTLSEVNVNIPVPDNTRGKDLNVTIARTHLKVGLRNQKDEFIVNAPLTKTIICDDSFWTVEDGNRLVLNLQKSNQMEWWDSVCQGDPTVDVTKIQPENSVISDLDGETQKTVTKMMFDQRQKANGLPTSEEQTKLDAIEQFKNQHPELDFSNAKIT